MEETNTIIIQSQSQNVGCNTFNLNHRQQREKLRETYFYILDLLVRLFGG
jgi:hypothetical protein